jgi:hypothetical protein
MRQRIAVALQILQIGIIAQIQTGQLVLVAHHT